jgi:phage virion morphogenesis protein
MTESIRIIDQEVRQLLHQLEAKLDDMTPVMKEIAGIMHHAVENTFEMEGRPRWPALAPATIRAREKKGHWPGKLLHVSGKTHNSWVSAFAPHAARVGSNYLIAVYNELGTKRGIPARPVRTLTARDIGEIKLKLMEYLFKRQ